MSADETPLEVGPLMTRQVQELVHRADEITLDDYLLSVFSEWVDDLEDRTPWNLFAPTPLDFFESLLIDFDYFVDDKEANFP